MAKNKTNPAVDKYLLDGCMRCKYGATPDCKVNLWNEELVALREIILASGLTEDLKWSIPCYTHNDQNILILSAFKNYCAISFFKGSLMKDTAKLLEKPGENSQAARLLKFTQLTDIIKKEKTIANYIAEAIKIEDQGLKVTFKKDLEPIPSELVEKFSEFPELQKAFYSLTPGRQRGYIIYFSKPKQTQTRINRIEKYMSKILKGKGFNDR